MNEGESSGIQDRELTIKFNPRKLMKFSLVFVVLILVFFAGRWTAPDGAPADVADDKSGFWSSLTGIFSDDDPTGAVTQKEEVKAEKKEEPKKEEKKVEEKKVEPKKVEKKVEKKEEKVEPIITTYSKVAISLGQPTTKWYGNWGKITHLQYTIKNNEAGTIKPAYFLMTLKGYDDIEKKVPVSAGSLTIKSGQVSSAKVEIPSGYAYNPASINLNKAVIITTLRDGTQKPMASAVKNLVLPNK